MSQKTTITEYFDDLDDPRKGNNKTHPLINIITIAICGVISGADGWVDIESYGNAKAEWLNTFLDLSKGIPSHDTFGRVFRQINPDEFQASFITWTQAISQLNEGEIVSLDGKKLRRSKDSTHGKDGIWMVSAWASENNLVLGQEKVDDKSNEITAIPTLLKLLDIEGCIVTIDAIGTQTEIVEQIVDSKADYILPVKGNQKGLSEDIRLLFDGFEADDYVDVEHDPYKQHSVGHGREEMRECWMVDKPEYLDFLRNQKQWKNLRSLAKLKTTRTQSGKTTVTIRYFISSLLMDAQHFIHAVRHHWQIENGLHWVLDIAFREDDSRIRKENAPQNMAIIRHIATNLLKQEKTAKIGVKAKRKKAGWDNDYLLTVLKGNIN